MSTSDLDETQAVRGMARAIAEMRRKGVGWLEALIAIAIVVVLLSAFLTGYFVIGELARQAARDRRAAAQRAETEMIARDVRALLIELRAAVAQGPESSRRAIDELSRRFEESQRKQTRTIVRENKETKTVVIYVTPSPQPQPTATVTCDPTPIVSQRPCRRG